VPASVRQARIVHLSFGEASEVTAADIVTRRPFPHQDHRNGKELRRLSVPPDGQEPGKLCRVMVGCEPRARMTTRECGVRHDRRQRTGRKGAIKWDERNL
jgi:hypothetical protein